MNHLRWFTGPPARAPPTIIGFTLKEWDISVTGISSLKNLQKLPTITRSHQIGSLVPKQQRRFSWPLGQTLARWQSHSSKLWQCQPPGLGWFLLRRCGHSPSFSSHLLLLSLPVSLTRQKPLSAWHSLKTCMGVQTDMGIDQRICHCCVAL